MRDSRVERNYRNMHDIFEQAIDARVPVTVQYTRLTEMHRPPLRIHMRRYDLIHNGAIAWEWTPEELAHGA